MPNGDPLILGNQNNTSSAETLLRSESNVPTLHVRNPNSYGVIGSTDRAAGVWGGGQSGSGVWGTARSGRGVLGGSIDGIAVRGEAQGATDSAIAISGISRDNSTGWAGSFRGRVYIFGAVTAEGGYNRAAALPSDGSRRQIYALESPESWFEDLGRAEVVDGRAEVKLDDEFAAFIQTDDYHVFLTPEGDSQGLYVSARNPDRFEVREQQGGTSTLAFSYRVAAKRSDIEAERLQRVEAPEEEDAFSEIPELPEQR